MALVNTDDGLLTQGFFKNKFWGKLLNMLAKKLNVTGDGSNVTITPDGTSTGYDLGSSTTLKAFAQKFKNLVGALKALAFKDKASYSDLSSGVQSSLDKADSALQSAVEYVTTSSTWQTLETAYNADKTLILKVENGTNWFDEYRITAVNKSSGSDRFIFCGFPTMVNLDNGSVESLEVTEWICYLDGSTTRWINSTTVNGLELTTKGYVDGKLPASAGTSGQYLKSNGSNNAPSWDDTSNIVSGETRRLFGIRKSLTKNTYTALLKVTVLDSINYAYSGAIFSFTARTAGKENVKGIVTVSAFEYDESSTIVSRTLLLDSKNISNSNNIPQFYVRQMIANNKWVYELWVKASTNDCLISVNVVNDSRNYLETMSDTSSTAPERLTECDLYSNVRAKCSGNSINSSKVGDTTTPVYVDTDGQVKACSTALKCIFDYGNVENQGAAAGKYGLLATMYLGNTTNSQVNASFMLYFTDSHSNSTQSISQAELRINKRVNASIIAMLTCYDSTFTDKVETIVTWNSSNYSIYVYLKSKTGTWFGVRGVPIQAGTHGGSTNTYPAIVLHKNTFSLSSTEGIAATLNTRTILYA